MFIRIVLFSIIFFTALKAIAQKQVNTITVQILHDTNQLLNRFVPSENIGAAFDGHWNGEIKKIMQKENILEMKTAGLKPISYRLRTELGDEAWHWNPKGNWSEQAKQRGYWVSSEDTDEPIELSHGYFLPRRGNTHDNANDDGYSRIDDGDTNTFWKSNPYLDHHFTNEDDSLHPQWVVIDFGRIVHVNGLRILWNRPYAVSYSLEYAGDIGKDYFEPYQPGLWHVLKNNIDNDRNINRLVPFSDKTVALRFIKITMFRSSYNASASSNDLRDKIGFSIKEIEAGIIDEKKLFHDLLKHTKNNKSQSVIRVSSTDPWHRATDMDVNTEQVGIDLFYKTGLANNVPAMLPIALLYDTPENMFALMHYVLKKKYPVSELEMGEEPEGQLIHPNDYAALYKQWADTIEKIAPSIKMGGPGFATLAKDDDEDASTFSERQWMKIFLQWLRQHNSLHQFQFFSFEWYPFDNTCVLPSPQLVLQPGLLLAALKPFKEGILPHNTQIHITEYGYSAYSGHSEVTIEGGLLYADIMAQFLALGGNKSYLYGYDPTYPDESDHCGWGNNMLFGMDDKGKIIYHTAGYYATKMMTGYWAQPADSILEMYPVTTSNKLISAYALLCPGNKWSLAIINKDPSQSKNIKVSVADKQNNKTTSFHSSIECIQYSSSQYHWKINGAESYPDKSLPPLKKKLTNQQVIRLPPSSLTILKEF